MTSEQNIDHEVVAGFGDEWSRFDQSGVKPDELERMFNEYFSIFPWDVLKADAVGFDLGCGSGRWAKIVAPRVGTLHLIDASNDALDVAKRNLMGRQNCRFHHASVDAIPLEDESCDFGYSLGVLHHIPDTEAGLRSCVQKLKPGAPFLLYLYYDLDNRPGWYRNAWKLTEPLRKFVSKLPGAPRSFLSNVIASLVYFPVARFSLLLERLGVNVRNMPLSQYRNSSFYVMRNDALDRFGTRLERRFSRDDMKKLMADAGLEKITFGDIIFWVAVGYKRSDPNQNK